MSEFIESDWFYTGSEDPPIGLQIEIWDDIELRIRRGQLDTDGRHKWWEFYGDASVYDKHEHWRYIREATQ